ncbi:MAG: hypothetical protein M5U34_03335 [Chloroflexi bacterium]|nr:hypothetical protein [Chloroflexota bacterium]
MTAIVSSPTPLPSATAVPIQLPAQTAVNGMPASQFIILPDGAVENIRAIYARGQNWATTPRLFQSR